MTGPSHSEGPASDAQDMRELENHNVISIVHMDGTVRQIQTEIIGDPTQWFNRTLVCIMMAQNLGSTAAWSEWMALTNNHNRVNQGLGLPENDHRLSVIWLVGSSIGFLIVGRLSDLYGRRWLIINTSLLGFIGTCLGYAGGSIGILIASNIFNGVAAAARLSFGFVIVATLLGPFVAALINTVIMSHGLHDSDSRWRWHYNLEMGCAFISTCLYFRCYYPPSWKQLNVGGGTRLQSAKNLDIVGIFLFASAENQWGNRKVVMTLLGAFMWFLWFFVYALGFIETVTWTGVTYIWQPQDIGLAFGSLGCLCSLSCAFARVGFASILDWQLKVRLPKYVDPVVQQAGLPPPSKTTVVDLPAFDAIHGAVSDAYASSFKMVLLLSMIFAVSMWLSAIFVPKLETYLSPNVARRLESPRALGNNSDQNEEQGIELGVVSRDA
ncbi:hypothetical protein LY76DRAFT_622259 [Colletotrichum caudatum]|nr:hypothetical protein LY76DRAFT_622259 [Colletotrichum caudatum]